ncbi:integrase, catalytic region, zinc finger, CCHC-type containing protein [Tanacetum coccineum]
MDKLIAHVSEKTYAYGAIRAENQNLLVTISELKARMKNGENDLDIYSVASKFKIDEASASKVKDKIVLWVVDSGCLKHMMGDRALLRNFVEKFIGTVCFGNDNFAAITGYGDYIHGNITICHVYYVEGLGQISLVLDNFVMEIWKWLFVLIHVMFKIWKEMICSTDGRSIRFYILLISDMAASFPICLMSTQLQQSHGYGIDDFHIWKRSSLFACCKRKNQRKLLFPPKLIPVNTPNWELLHMICLGLMRVAFRSLDMKYILVIVDDFSRFTWVYFLRSRDETPEIIKKFIAQAQLNHKAKVCKIRTDNGTEFKNATLKVL